MFYLALVVFLTKLYRLSVIGYRLDIKAVQIQASPR